MIFSSIQVVVNVWFQSTRGVKISTHGNSFDRQCSRIQGSLLESLFRMLFHIYMVHVTAELICVLMFYDRPLCVKAFELLAATLQQNA